MHVVVTRPGELGPAEVAAWHDAQDATPALANPFLSPEFAQAVGRFRPQARVAVLMSGPVITGFFGFERRRFGAGVPLCGLPGTFCQGLVHAPGEDWDPGELLRGCGLSAWQFDHLIAGQHPFARYQAAAETAPVIDLSRGFADYYASLQERSAHFCRDLARKTRKLEREIGPLRFVDGSGDTALLHTMMGWKAEQYLRNGWVYQFGRPWATGLLETLLATRGARVSGLLTAAYAGDRPIAAQFALRSQTTVAGWFSSYDRAFARYSPGLLHLLQLTAELPGTGVRTVEMGEGAARYKEQLKSRDDIVSRGIVTGRSALAAAHRAAQASRQRIGAAVYRHPRLYRGTRLLRGAVR